MPKVNKNVNINKKKEETLEKTMRRFLKTDPKEVEELEKQEREKDKKKKD